jgi:predicted homoserine dehydrogenase-like protein
MLYRPYHLLGVETATSILSAALLEIPSGAFEIHPRLDLVARSAVELKGGSTLEIENEHALLEPLILPAMPRTDKSPIPLYMALGRRLIRDVPPHTVLTNGMIEPPAESALWRLRRDQDRIFLEGNSEVV